MTNASLGAQSRPHTDGAWDEVPVQTRSARFTSEQVDDFQPVTGLESVWKFTPVSKLERLLDGQLRDAPELHFVNTTSGVSIERLTVDSASRGRAGLPEERGSANAWSQVQVVTSIKVDGTKQKLVAQRRLNRESASCAHTIIEALPQSQGLVILEHSGDGEFSENVEILVGDGAQLTVVTVQEWSDTAKHLSSHFARIGRDASLKHIVVSLSGEVVRINPSLHLSETGASVEALGAYFATSGQHLEQQVYIDHDAPHTKSRVNYKGALQGAGARSVWIGDVLIRQSATGTDSYEQNRNIVLTDGTRADSIPNLEIETGDIAGAGHASATGRFDEEHLFYLMSRGISETDARRLVVRGFLFDVIQNIGDEELESSLQSSIDATLDSKLGE